MRRKVKNWDKALADWKTLYSDDDAKFDTELNIKAEDIEPMITYGTNPGMGIGITGHVPDLNEIDDKRQTFLRKISALHGHRAWCKNERQKSRLCFHWQLHQCTY